MDKTTSVIVGITLVVFAAIVVGSAQSTKNFNPATQCVQHSNSLSMHIHPVVKIFFDDAPVTIPSNIGIDPSCMKALHTHDESGTIHVEYPQTHDFVLADFFANWGMPFFKDQIMDKKIDATHTLTMTVDGKPSDQFDKLVLKDGQQIVIRYASKSP